MCGYKMPLKRKHVLLFVSSTSQSDIGILDWECCKCLVWHYLGCHPVPNEKRLCSYCVNSIVFQCSTSDKQSRRINHQPVPCCSSLSSQHLVLTFLVILFQEQGPRLNFMIRYFLVWCHFSACIAFSWWLHLAKKVMISNKFGSIQHNLNVFGCFVKFVSKNFVSSHIVFPINIRTF